MNAISAVAPPSQANGLLGPVVMILMLVLLIAGFVVIVRILLRHVHDSTSAAARRDRLGKGFPTRGKESKRSPTGRVLKQRYLRGELSRVEFEEELHRLQVDEYLKKDR